MCKLTGTLFSTVATDCALYCDVMLVLDSSSVAALGDLASFPLRFFLLLGLATTGMTLESGDACCLVMSTLRAGRPITGSCRFLRAVGAGPVA